MTKAGGSVDHLSAVRRHVMWFGSYKKSGELKKLPVWCFVKDGKIEFLTGGDSFKVKRIRKNPAVTCSLGKKDGPSLEGVAEVVTNREEIWRGYRAYWKTHPWMMCLLGLSIRRNVRLGRQVMIRVKPNEPSPLEGMTDQAI